MQGPRGLSGEDGGVGPKGDIGDRGPVGSTGPPGNDGIPVRFEERLIIKGKVYFFHDQFSQKRSYIPDVVVLKACRADMPHVYW